MEDKVGSNGRDISKKIKKKNDDVKQKLHFSQKFDNPLKGFPYNESVEVDDGLPEVEDIREDKSSTTKENTNVTLMHSIREIKIYHRM